MQCHSRWAEDRSWSLVMSWPCCYHATWWRTYTRWAPERPWHCCGAVPISCCLGHLAAGSQVCIGARQLATWQFHGAQRATRIKGWLVQVRIVHTDTKGGWMKKRNRDWGLGQLVNWISFDNVWNFSKWDLIKLIGTFLVIVLTTQIFYNKNKAHSINLKNVEFINNYHQY